jgi:hypothetical protein
MPAATVRRRGETDYAPPQNDAYIVLLVISLVAMILGCALLFFDYSSYPDGKPPPVNVRQPAPIQPVEKQAGPVDQGKEAKDKQ